MCKKPLFAYKETIINNATGEVVNRLRFFRDYDTWVTKRDSSNDDEKLRFLRVPCGQCIDCRLKYSKEWASRIICEQVTSQSSLFVTLTYDDEHLPLNELGLSYIRYDDLTKFLKALREKIFRDYGVRELRYYACGEYGSINKRAHFHLCLFNLPQSVLDEMKFYKTSFSGDCYFNSDYLFEVWKKGFVVCGDLSYQSAAYVARYVTKKLKGKQASFYDEFKLTPECSRMSLKPGIGFEYYKLFKEKIYKNDELFLPSVGKVQVSRYFDKLFDFEDPERLREIKNNRVIRAENNLRIKLSKTDLDELSLLDVELKNLEKSFKSLVRPL